MRRNSSFNITVDPEFMEKLNRIKSLFSTKHARGIGFEKIFTILMEEYLDRHSPDRRIQRRKERKQRSSAKKIKSRSVRNRGVKEVSDTNHRQRENSAEPRSAIKSEKERRRTEKFRHMPQSVRDEIFARDGGRRAFVGDNGVRCTPHGISRSII